MYGKHTRPLAATASVLTTATAATAIALLLTACGSSGNSGDSADKTQVAKGGATDDSAGTSAAESGAPGASGASSASDGSAGSGGSGSGTNPATVDVCALLSPADANEVARANGLDGAQTAATTYKLTATKQTPTGIDPSSSCEFTISDDGAEGTVAFQVASAAHFSVYSSGKKVSGLGDEAYDDGSSTVMRVGSLMISPGEDSFQEDFTTDLLRKMAPNLK
jgi:hypothetical protein